MCKSLHSSLQLCVGFNTNVNHLHRGRAPYENEELNMSKFDQHFFNLLTREINTLVGRKGCGTIWAGRNRTNECVDDESLERQLFYAATNMVKDGLLVRAAHNPGYGSYRAIASGDLNERFWYIDRTAWHRAGGQNSKKPLSAFKKWVTVHYSKLPKWESLTDSQYATLFRREVRALEKSYREKRELEGKRAAGPKKLSKLDHRERPKTPRRRTRQPKCHASSPEAAREYEKSWRLFLDERLKASYQFLCGNLFVEFPLGSFRPPLVSLETYRPLRER